MYKLISAIILLALSSVSLNAFSAAAKVEVCHKGQEVNVASSSLSAHMAHGDDEGECSETPTEPDPDKETAVVIMRCEAGSMVSLKSSFEDKVAIILPEPPPEFGVNCAELLADLLNYRFQLRSITAGSAGENGNLSLFTDYLLIGNVDES